MHRSFLVALMVAIAVPCQAEDRLADAYALAKPPLEILAAMAELKLGGQPAMPADERALLTRVWEYRHARRGAAEAGLDDHVALDAMLWASGVEDAQAREQYRNRFERLVADAKKAIGEADNDRNRGERLLKHLHAGAMSKGYKEDQSSLAAVLDRGEFNCVSSTAVYVLVGARLGLQLQPISIPGNAFLAGHASLDLLDGGTRVQVEPTNPDGFDWATKVKRPGVVVLGYVPDRKDGRQTDALGIAASIYTNRGVGLTKRDAPNRQEGVRCFLSALALDPGNPTATNNLLSIIMNWGHDLAEQEKYAESIRVLEYGVGVAPKSVEMRDHLTNVWSRQIAATLDSRDAPEAIKLIRRAAESVPTERDFQKTARWFEQHAERVRNSDGWEAALQAVDRGIELLSPGDAKPLLAWRSSLFRRWSQSLLDQQDVDGSIEVLARAYALDTRDREIRAGLSYHLATALEQLDDDEEDEDHKDTSTMARHFHAVARRFPQVKEVAEAGHAHGLRAVHKLADAGKFSAALTAAKRYETLIVEPKQRNDLAITAYQRWGRKLVEQKRWREALDKIAEGLRAFPGDQRLVDESAATVHAWASPAIKAKQWDEAIRIYDLGLEQYAPGHRDLLHNREYCEAMKKKGE